MNCGPRKIEMSRVDIAADQHLTHQPLHLPVAGVLAFSEDLADLLKADRARALDEHGVAGLSDAAHHVGRGLGACDMLDRADVAVAVGAAELADRDQEVDAAVGRVLGDLVVKARRSQRRARPCRRARRCGARRRRRGCRAQRASRRGLRCNSR